MTGSGYTLPIERFQGAFGAGQRPNPGNTLATGDHPSFSEIASLLGKGHHHAGTQTKSVLSSDSSSDSTDAFGVSTSGSSPSVDSFGAASNTPSSTANLVSGINDPFSSIASNFQIQAQLNSQQLLNL